MAAVTTVYNKAKTRTGLAGFNFASDTYKLMLLTAGYTLDATAIDNHEFRSDVTAFEASGTGYTAGGVTLTSVGWTQDNTNDRTLWTFTVPTITTATITYLYATVYKSLGGAASADPLFGTITYDAPQIITGQDILFQTDALGFMGLRQAA